MLLGNILVDEAKATVIVQACCVLHNMLRTKMPTFTQQVMDSENPGSHEIIPGSWRTDRTLQNMECMKGNNMTKAGKAHRDYICEYVNSEAGSVSWQEDMI